MRFETWKFQIAIGCLAALAICGSHICLAQANSSEKASNPIKVSSAASTSNTQIPQTKLIEKDGVYQVGGPVLPPKLLKAPTPKYTWAAKRAHFEGDCILSTVIDTTGRTREITVVKAVGFGLEKRAVDALKKYQFAPATLRGHAVAARINVVIKFRIY